MGLDDVWSIGTEGQDGKGIDKGRERGNKAMGYGIMGKGIQWKV